MTDETPTPDDIQPIADTVTTVSDTDVELPEPVADLEPELEDVVMPPAVVVTPTAEASKMKWYVVKVQSGREESIKAAIERKVKIEGLEPYIAQIIIPVERVIEVKKTKETKNGEKVTKEKKVVKEKKKFPGYLMTEVEFNDKVLYLFRETSGVGDFVGAAPGKPPVPMSDREVAVMLGSMLPEKDRGKVPASKTKVKLDFEKGDKVRIREGAFANMEGEVKEITEPKDSTETPKVTVEVSIFGRPVPVELDYWQVDKL